MPYCATILNSKFVQLNENLLDVIYNWGTTTFTIDRMRMAQNLNDQTTYQSINITYFPLGTNQLNPLSKKKHKNK